MSSVRVNTTNNGVRNPGLMQSHNGTGTCMGVDDCSCDEIQQMSHDGTRGTIYGNGLANLLNQVQAQLGDSDLARVFYSAARLYNSGAIDYNNLDDGEGSTACYASDIANRLTGWVLAPSKCTAH